LRIPPKHQFEYSDALPPTERYSIATQRLADRGGNEVEQVRIFVRHHGNGPIITKVFKRIFATRTRINALAQLLKSVSGCPIKSAINDTVRLWRNRLKKLRSDYLTQELFTMKEFDREGVRYIVSLEGFEDPGIGTQCTTLYVPKVKGWDGPDAAEERISLMRDEVARGVGLLASIIHVVSLGWMKTEPWLHRMRRLGAYGTEYKVLLEELRELAGSSEEDLARDEPEHKRLTKEVKMVVHGDFDALKEVVNSRFHHSHAKNVSRRTLGSSSICEEEL
jgi:hypothetical protein